MKLAICSKRDLTSLVLLNDLLPRLELLPDCRIQILLAVRTREIETIQPELTAMKYLERDLPFGQLRLDRLDAQRRHTAKEPLFGLNELEERYGASVSSVTSWAAAADALNRFHPDLILSIRFSFPFREPFLSSCRHGIINVHPGRIPDYAGLYPHFYSMLTSQEMLGCTVHYVDAGIDSGPVLAEGAVPIDRNRSAFVHNLDSHLLGNELAAGIVTQIARGRRPTARPQARPARKPNTYPTEEEFARFRSAGLSLIQSDEYMELMGRFGVADQLRLEPNRLGMPVPAERAEEGRHA